MNDKIPTTDEARRNFLKKAGALAVYTPPAMMVLMQPSVAAASSGRIRVNCNNGLGNGSEGCSPNQPWTPNYNQDE